MALPAGIGTPLGYSSSPYSAGRWVWTGGYADLVATFTQDADLSAAAAIVRTTAATLIQDADLAAALARIATSAGAIDAEAASTWAFALIKTASGTLVQAAQLEALGARVQATSGLLEAEARLLAKLELQLVSMGWPGETFFGGHAITDTPIQTAATLDMCELRAVSQYYQESA